MNRTPYDGSHTYDFLAALGAAPVSARTYWDTLAYADGQTVRPPTRDKLDTHARRYGVECVNETAAIYGVDMKLRREPSKPKRSRRTTGELRGQVLELRSRGLVGTAIADALNVSDRRVNTILAAAAA